MVRSSAIIFLLLSKFYRPDIVPIVPGRFLGFQHPHGEVHILSPGNAVSCPGGLSTSHQVETT